MAQATAVTAGNRHLAEVALRVNANVHVVPTPMDTALYRIKPVRREGELVLGWSGSSATNPYAMRMARVVSQLARRHPRLVFEVISNDERSLDWSAFAPARTRFKRWSLVKSIFSGRAAR